MTIKEGIAGGAIIAVSAVAAVGFWAFDQNTGTTSKMPAAIAPASEVKEPHPSLLYGRITVGESTTVEGQVRWGRDREAFWGDTFYGVKVENPWFAHLPEALRPAPIEIFGVEVADGDGPIQPVRQFLMRFGDIARIERTGRNLNVTLKSGAVFVLDYFEQTDFESGVRVWDARQGVFDLGPRHIRVVEFFAAPGGGLAPARLYGTVRTENGAFTGFVQWNRKESIGTDELDGRANDEDVRVRFDTIRSIARQSAESLLVTLLDGGVVTLSGTPEAGNGNLGVYVDDMRYGRVLVSWDAFERLDFTPGGSGPVYGDFPPGRALSGSVTTRDGRHLAGRLVFDLDESETTETLDAPSQGVNYMIPFGLIASLDLAGASRNYATVTLQSGEKLRLYKRGDLSPRNGGMLVFADDAAQPEYVIWANVERISFDSAKALSSAPPRARDGR